jgi:hypothetical protein
MPCVWHGKDVPTASPNRCAILSRAAAVHGRPPCECPHDGDGERCDFVKAKLAESHDA